MFEVMFHWNFDDFFLQISKFLSKKYNRQRWKNSFLFRLKRQFFLSWEIHRSKNRCRSKIYNGKISLLFFIRKLLGILGEYSYSYWLFIINSTVILKFLANNMYVYFVSYSFLCIPIERKKLEEIIHLHVLFYLLANISDYIYWTYSITRSFTQCNHIIS